MADDKTLEQQLELTNSVKSSILEAIKRNLETEKRSSIGDLGKITGAITDLAARDLYSKGPPDNNYSKNTQNRMPGIDVIRTIDEISAVIKSREK